MKIIIIGCGKVGLKTAFVLSEKNHDIVLIDENEDKMRDVSNKLDVICMTGNGIEKDVLISAGIERTDLLIATTSYDEVNMICCLLGKNLGVKHTIARVRNPLYYNQISLLKDELKLSMVVNPERLCAKRISKMILFPNAVSVETFARDKIDLLEYKVSDTCIHIGMTLNNFNKELNIPFVVSVVSNGEEVIIPNGDYKLRKGDFLYIIIPYNYVENFFAAIGKKNSQVNNIIIGGGGRITYYLGEILSKTNKSVKIIEKDKEKAIELSDKLEKVTIIEGDVTDQSLLDEEGLKNQDVFIGLTGKDEENIISALYAESLKLSKTIVKVNDEKRAKLLKSIGLFSFVSPKDITSDSILSYVKAIGRSKDIEGVETIYSIASDKAFAMEFIIRVEREYVGKELSTLHIIDNTIIGGIIRGRDVIIPSGTTSIQVGDRVVVITLNNNIENFSDILKR